MPKEKFNPIAQLPILPGAEIAKDEAQSNIIDSTYPPVKPVDKEVEVKETKKPQIEIRLKAPVPEEVVIENEGGKNLLIVRTVILVCLVVLVVLGILLTLNLVPKVANNMSGFSKSFVSIFTPNKTGLTPTSTPKIPAYIPLVATSTPKTIAVASVNTNQISTNQPITNQTVTTQPATVQTATTSQPKAPAKLSVSMLSTNVIGNQTVVKFNIQNVGGTTSGPWSFSAKLPSSMTPTYYSVVQNSLTPQSGVVYTLSFIADQYTNSPVQITLYTK